jgi:hypothetical protein
VSVVGGKAVGEGRVAEGQNARSRVTVWTEEGVRGQIDSKRWQKEAREP